MAIGQGLGGEAVEVLGQVFGFVQRQQRLNDGQALEHALHGWVGGRRIGLAGEAGKLAQEVLGQLGFVNRVVTFGIL